MQTEVDGHAAAAAVRMKATDRRLADFETFVAVLPTWKEDLVRCGAMSREFAWERCGMLEEEGW